MRLCTYSGPVHACLLARERGMGLGTRLRLPGNQMKLAHGHRDRTAMVMYVILYCNSVQKIIL